MEQLKGTRLTEAYGRILSLHLITITFIIVPAEVVIFFEVNVRLREHCSDIAA